MFTLTVFSLNKEVIEIKEFDNETEARIYYQEKYGVDRDDFGNVEYYYNLD